MAIKSLYEFGDGLYPNAYYMIRKITVGNSDEEYFEEDANGFETLKFKKHNEATAFVFVYGDKEGRENGARPINAYGISFDYDPESGLNIYKEAYKALKNTATIQNGVWEDV